MLSALGGQGPRATSVAFPKERYRLHAMVTSAGYDRRADRSYDWHGLKRGVAPFVLLQHTISGRGRLRYEAIEHDVLPGQTMLLSFPHDSRYWVTPGTHWEFFWLCLNGREVMRLWRELVAKDPLVRLPEASIERLAGECLSVLEGEASSPTRCSRLAYTITMNLADDLLALGKARTISERPAAVERAVSLCLANAKQPVDVGRMARASGYSRYHFSRVFSENVGIPPGRYQLRLRMEEAARQLRSQADPVNVIAQACGFADANYFTKVFRRYYGMTPRDFRRSGMFFGQVIPSGQ